MLTCMALAHRTAEQISGQRDELPAAADSVAKHVAKHVAKQAAKHALDTAPAA